ncbi:glycosyltransferase family 4 protein [Nitratidesulfovibrio sp.]|uniref:glycosyltransferase family 4 protein n=1 Tax=Nitratidesulfovibrio sp. TaxID=2802297 RepID=UPI003342246C
MRLTFVHPNLAERGGAERKMLLIIAELLRRGHDVQLLVNRFVPETTFHELLPDGFAPTVLPGRKPVWCARVLAHLLRTPPDVTVAHNHPAQFPVGLFGLLHPESARAWICNEVMPMLAPRNGMAWKAFYAVDKALVRRFGRCIVNSGFTAESFRSWYGGEPERIYSGVQLYEEIAPTITDDAPWMGGLPERFILVLSRLEHHKNLRFLETMAEALAGLPIVVAGRGHDQDYVADLAQRMPGVTYLGGVSEPQKFHLYRKASVFAFLPTAEPLGVTTMEAIGAGTPVVAFNSGGPREVILDGRNGSLCDTEDAYIAALRQWLGAGAAARDAEDFEGYIRKNFSNAVMVRRFADCILGLRGVPASP